MRIANYCNQKRKVLSENIFRLNFVLTVRANRYTDTTHSIKIEMVTKTCVLNINLIVNLVIW